MWVGFIMNGILFLSVSTIPLFSLPIYMYKIFVEDVFVTLN